MKKVYYSLLMALLITFSLSSGAQDSTRRVIGISATIQSAQYGIMIPIWIGNRFSIAPSFDLNWGKTVGTDYAISIVPKFYFTSRKFAPYICIRGGFAS